MNPSLSQVYLQFLSPLVDTSGDNSGAWLPHDPEWPSECVKNIIDGRAYWRAVERCSDGDFSGIEKALNLNVHPDIRYLFGHFWCGHVAAQTDRGKFDVLHAWNDEDFDMLLQNIVGHIMMKRRLGQEITIFFATTDEEDFILSVKNKTGEVVLEQVGCEPQEILSPDLASFFATASLRSEMFQAD